MKRYMMDAQDVAKELDISKGYAYKIIRELNDELKTQGYLTLTGKIPRPYWEKKFYCYDPKDQVNEPMVG